VTPAVATHGAALPVSKPGLPRSCDAPPQPVTVNEPELVPVLRQRELFPRLPNAFFSGARLFRSLLFSD